ncbi:sulfotransferase family protein [uncultured Umboniibacter sp.]|uniref:sulfotransferase family protein n=1 Tax=uncultured Umboniibacter sp. TaxID=1798917 RepID=UPI00262B4AE8|nr:sulfotransferase family protein [uncultured Umboniibacter sp.]
MKLQNIFYARHRDLIFLSNPKCGCTTIKNSLSISDIPEGEDIHSSANAAGLTFPPHLDVPIFAVTRNPYSRILSCFLDKFNFQGDAGGERKKRYFNQLGFDAPQKISFLTFLQRVRELPTLETANAHYRPQVFNLYKDDIQPQFIGRLEEMGEVASFLSKHRVELKTRRHHATGSSETYKDLISKEEASIIQDIYQDDFDTFGYSTDLLSDFVPPASYRTQRVSERLQIVVKAKGMGLWAKDLKLISENREAKNPIQAKHFQAAAALLRKQVALKKSPAKGSLKV